MRYSKNDLLGISFEQLKNLECQENKFIKSYKCECYEKNKVTLKLKRQIIRQTKIMLLQHDFNED